MLNLMYFQTCILVFFTINPTRINSESFLTPFSIQRHCSVQSVKLRKPHKSTTKEKSPSPRRLQLNDNRMDCNLSHYSLSNRIIHNSVCSLKSNIFSMAQVWCWDEHQRLEIWLLMLITSNMWFKSCILGFLNDLRFSNEINFGLFVTQS